MGSRKCLAGSLDKAGRSKALVGEAGRKVEHTAVHRAESKVGRIAVGNQTVADRKDPRNSGNSYPKC
jgi:hypothetical protein